MNKREAAPMPLDTLVDREYGQYVVAVDYLASRADAFGDNAYGCIHIMRVKMMDTTDCRSIKIR